MVNDDHLSIVVKSPVVHNNDLVGRIISKALLDVGFQYVTTYTQQGDPVKPRPLVSVLDAVRSLTPETFHAEVKIWTDPPVDATLVLEEILEDVEIEGNVEEVVE